MIYSDEKKFIFIHVPKTGGTSLTEVLRPCASIGVNKQYSVPNGSMFHETVMKHVRALHLKKFINNNIWDSYFKFGFVRNPWALLLSLYSWMIKYRKKQYKYHNFTHYIQRFSRSYSPERTKLLYGGQYAYYHNKKGKCLVNKIYRFENYRKAVSQISKRLGFKIKVPHVFKTMHTHYRNHYTENTRKIVGEIFARDIETFKYKF